MHTGALANIKANNRTYGSRSEHSVINALYPKMIPLFSQFTPPRKIDCFPAPDDITCGIFPRIGAVQIGDVTLDVIDGIGGHTIGQIFLYDAIPGLLFTADSVIKFSSISPERATSLSLAAFLVISVNVDSDLAKKERHALLDLAAETDRKLSGT